MGLRKHNAPHKTERPHLYIIDTTQKKIYKKRVVGAAFQPNNNQNASSTTTKIRDQNVEMQLMPTGFFFALRILTS